MKTYVVLTGDLIGSRELAAAQLEEAMDRIGRLATEFEETRPGTTVGRPDVFRGDSWQWCLQKPALALTAAVFLRAGLKAENFDSRVGIGIGTIASLHEEKISTSTGPAFVASGSALDALEKDRTLGFAHGDEVQPVWAEAVGGLVAPLLDLHIGYWSQRESVAVYGTLRNFTQQAIADLPASRTQEGKAPTRQAVQDALHRIRWATHVAPALARAESVLGV